MTSVPVTLEIDGEEQEARVTLSKNASTGALTLDIRRKGGKEFLARVKFKDTKGSHELLGKAVSFLGIQ